uniref:C-type lectin domain-containing protein n=1 Tax=Cairina moschata TaxID=8855 RepID=A0A8C3CDV3_CAIMO
MAPTWTPGLWLLGCLLLVPALWGECPLSDCSPGWVPVSGGCLGFFPWELSWSRAEAFCRRFGSRTHLASVHSEEELQAVADLLFSRSGDASEEELDEEVWIGLHRPLRSRSWQWSDGTAVAYNSWHRASFTRRRACAALQDATAITPAQERRAHVGTCKAPTGGGFVSTGYCWAPRGHAALAPCFLTATELVSPFPSSSSPFPFLRSKFSSFGESPVAEWPRLCFACVR